MTTIPEPNQAQKTQHPLFVAIVSIRVSERRISPIVSTFSFVLVIPPGVRLYQLLDPAYRWRFSLATSEVFGEIISKVTNLFANRIIQSSTNDVSKAFLEVLNIFLVRSWHLADLVFDDIGSFVLSHGLQGLLFHLQLEVWRDAEEVDSNGNGGDNASEGSENRCSSWHFVEVHAVTR